MTGKKRKKVPVRPVVSLRVQPLMYEDLTREATKRKLKLSEEVERRLLRYLELEADKAWEEKADDTHRFQTVKGRSILGASLADDDIIDKLAQRIAMKLKQLKPE